MTVSNKSQNKISAQAHRRARLLRATFPVTQVFTKVSCIGRFVPNPDRQGMYLNIWYKKTLDYFESRSSYIISMSLMMHNRR